jgi:GT2 family glycosyltransferase
MGFINNTARKFELDARAIPSKDSGSRADAGLSANVQSSCQLAIVIVSWNTCDLLNRCLRSLKDEVKNSRFGAEHIAVYVVDNNSGDRSPDMVAKEHPWVILQRNSDNKGFARANNQVLQTVLAPFFLLLNPDTELRPGSLNLLMGFLENHPRACAVAPQLLNSDGTIQRSCREFPTFRGMLYELLGFSRLFPGVEAFRTYKMLDWGHDDERQVDQPEGACLLIRKEALDQIGPLDEGYFMLFEEVDWCYRAKQAGWEVWFTPEAQVVHHYGQSIKQAKARMILSSHRGLYRFWFKYYRRGRWYLDPFAYLGLMSLAYLRIASYWLKTRLRA